MLRPEISKLLADMLTAVDAIGEFIVAKSRADLKRDPLLRAAIYFEFIIIGEALSQLSKQDPATAARLSEHPRIIAFRNQIIHGYGKLNDALTWQIIVTKLP